jgi:hypothetical protein
MVTLVLGDDKRPWRAGRAMTEQEWLGCTDPQPMLEFLSGKASDRKLRLFAVACCRRVWNLLIDHRCRTLVEVAEKNADGLSTDAAMFAEFQAAFYPPQPSPQHIPPHSFAADAAAASAYDKSETPIGDAMFCAASAASGVGMASSIARIVGTEEEGRITEAKVQAILLRDIFSNLFRPIIINPFWLTWNDGTVIRLAQSIYDEHAFDRLPVLADALEKAGCDNPDILTHCRQPGEHVKGCWVVDLLLGKS